MNQKIWGQLILTVQFTVRSIPCPGLNGGPAFKHIEAFWQITLIAPTKAYTSPDRAAAKRTFDAMITMRKVDIASIEAVVRG